MKKVKSNLDDQIEIAKGGILDRRRFLMSGASLLSVITASSISTHAKAGVFDSYPKHMKVPGKPSEKYGLPSPFEKSVERTQEAYYSSGIFTGNHTPLERLNGTITPNGLHFSIHHNGIPEIDPDKHRLMIHGLVNKPLKWSVETLLNYPMVSRIQFLECAGNSAGNAVSDQPIDASCTALHGQMSCSEWTGIPLKHLLDEVGVKPNGKWVMCEGGDAGNHVRNVPVKKLYDDAIIALYQNGERIRPDQGYPMRLFLPGYEGNMNIKWLHRMEISDKPSQSKDEQSLYAEFTRDNKLMQFTFNMEVKSLITKPSGTQQLPILGIYEISGLAWSGRGKIKMVEVSADGGRTWAKAVLDGVVMSKSFTRFTIPWKWSGQKAVLLSRATDEFGNVQPTRQEWKSFYADYVIGHYNAINAWEVTSDGRVKNTYV